MADVLGTEFADLARDKLTIMIEELITESALITPKIEYQYDRHKVAKLQLNAVTIDLEDAEPIWEGIDGGPSVRWQLTFSLRVHTGYSGDHVDGRKVTRLCEGIANKLHQNLDLGSEYRMHGVLSITNYQQFDESASVGGEVRARIDYDLGYTQD